MRVNPKYAKKVFEIIKKNVDKVELDYSSINYTLIIQLRIDNIFIQTTHKNVLIFNNVEVDCGTLFVEQVVEYVRDYQDEKERKAKERQVLEAISIIESYEV